MLSSNWTFCNIKCSNVKRELVEANICSRFESKLNPRSMGNLVKCNWLLKSEGKNKKYNWLLKSDRKNRKYRLAICRLFGPLNIILDLSKCLVKCNWLLKSEGKNRKYNICWWFEPANMILDLSKCLIYGQSNKMRLTFKIWRKKIGSIIFVDDLDL